MRLFVQDLSLLVASFFSLRFLRNDGVRNFDFFSFLVSSLPLLTLVRVGETYKIQRQNII